MNLTLDPTLADGYKSPSQRSRVITEGWTAANMYCPVCGAPIEQYEANRPVADFHCPRCGAQFEQKSKKSKSASLPKKIAGGEYQKMLDRLSSADSPHLFVMTYNDGKVQNLIVIPNHFFTPSVVEARKALSDNARRHGWQGSYIHLADIPESGRIYIVRDGQAVDKNEVIGQYRKTLTLKTPDLNSRGWLLDVLKCVESIPMDEFALADVYAFTKHLQRKHPGNRFIQDKIRQQLQYLRDCGFVVFTSRGHYKKGVNITRFNDTSRLAQ